LKQLFHQSLLKLFYHLILVVVLIDFILNEDILKLQLNGKKLQSIDKDKTISKKKVMISLIPINKISRASGDHEAKKNDEPFDHWTPLWFSRGVDPEGITPHRGSCFSKQLILGKPFWDWGGTYWEARQKRQEIITTEKNIPPVRIQPPSSKRKCFFFLFMWLF
jgi:hypothetical protein